MEFRDYFQSELDYLAQLAEESAHEFPALSPFLSTSAGERDVEFLFEHFAFLSASLRQKIDDAFPEITQALLSRLFPLPLRPLPATTILKCTPKKNSPDTLIAKGTEVSGFCASKGDELPRRAVFQFCRDLNVIALDVCDVKTTHLPDGLILELDCHWLGALGDDGDWQTRPLTFYLGDDVKTAGLLKLLFCCYLEKSTLTSAGKTYQICSLRAGNPLSEQNRLRSILPIDVEQYSCLQLIPEYFSLPHVQDFLTLDMCGEYPSIPLSKDGRFTLRFAFSRDVSGDFSVSHFQLNCVPIINLFTYKSASKIWLGNFHPIDLPEENQFHSVIAVSEKQKSEDEGDRAHFVTYLPVTDFYRHFQENDQIFYHVRLTQDAVNRPSVALRFLNSAGSDIVTEEEKRIYYTLRCTGSDGVTELGIGDISEKDDTIPGTIKIRNMTPLTEPRPPQLDSRHNWLILSHLLLSPSFLANPDTLRQVILDFDLYSYARSDEKKAAIRRLEGIKSAKTKPIDRLFKGDLCRGLKLTLTFDPACFADDGDMYRLGNLIAEVFVYCLSSDCFLLVDMRRENHKNTWKLPPRWGLRSQL